MPVSWSASGTGCGDAAGFFQRGEMSFLQAVFSGGGFRAIGGCTAAALFLLVPISAPVQAQRGPALIGAATYLWGPTSDFLGLRDGLGKLGYQENRDFVLGLRQGEGEEAVLEESFRWLVGAGVQILYANGSKELEAARRVSSDLPIVFATWHNPTGAGWRRRLAGQRHRIVGVGNRFDRVHPDALAKFRLLIPGLKTVLLPYPGGDESLAGVLGALRDSARRLEIKLLERAIDSRAEAREAIMNTSLAGLDGILPIGGRANIDGYALEAALRRNVPVMFHRDWRADSGGLASYGPTWYDLGVQAAGLMDRVIRGKSPGNIPILLNDRPKLVINMWAAARLGLTLPREALQRADRIIPLGKPPPSPGGGH